MEGQTNDYSVAASKFLQTCDHLASDVKIEPFSIVIFGGTGDLSKRMLLPSLYHLKKDGRLPEDFSIVGFGLPEMSDEEFRNFARESVETFSPESFNQSLWDEFSQHLSHVSADFNGDQGYTNLYNRINELCVPTPENKREVIFFLAIPPSVAPVIITKLGQHKFCIGSIIT
jgi:glucose-6-phosphate 1-dehydrogenase